MSISREPISALNAGMSVRGLFRTAQGRFLRSSWRRRLLAALIVEVLVTGVTFAIGLDWIRTAIVTAIALAITGIVLQFSRVLLTTILVIGWSVGISPALAAGLLSQMVKHGAPVYIRDVAGASVSLSLGAALLAVAAHRWSRGRPAVTVFLALAASIALPFYILSVFPQSGLLSVYATMGLILVLRCGLWDALFGAYAQFRTRHVGDDVLARYAVLESAQTSGIADLSASTHVLEPAVLAAGKRRKFDTGNVSMAVVLDESGRAAVCAWIQTTKDVTETVASGIHIHGVDVAHAVDRLTALRRRYARVLGIPAARVGMFLVVSSVGRPGHNPVGVARTVGLFAAKTGEIARDTLTICGANDLGRQLGSQPSASRLQRPLSRARLLLSGQAGRSDV